jgi:preprotein translocase subunit SecG
MLYTVCAVFIIIFSILLTLVVLVQNSKGGGLAANFSAGNQAFGVRQTADFLEKATWLLALAILITCLAATASVANRSESNRMAIPDRLENVQSIPGQPEFPTTAPQPETEEPSELPL